MKARTSTKRKRGRPPLPVELRTPWIKSLSLTKQPPQIDVTAHNREAFARMLSVHRGDKRAAWIDMGRRPELFDAVYVIRMGSTDAYKIGMSGLVKHRLAQLQSSSPVPLQLVAWVSFFDGSPLVDAEYNAHRLASLCGPRLKGEWFDLKPEHISKVVDGLIDEFSDEIYSISYSGK